MENMQQPQPNHPRKTTQVNDCTGPMSNLTATWEPHRHRCQVSFSEICDGLVGLFDGETGL